MKCNVCNAELENNQSFCAYCGTKVELAPENKEPEATPAQAENPVSAETPCSAAAEENPNADKAKKGLIFGILANCIPFIGIIFGIIGIVNSSKGLRSKSKGMAIPGLALSIYGLVENVILVIYVLYFLWVFAMTFLMQSQGDIYQILSFLV